MHIVVRDIPAEGLDLSLNTKKDPWFHKAVEEALLEAWDKSDVDTALLQLFRTNQNVDIVGEIRCSCHLNCSRCLKKFTAPLCIPIHYTMAPLYESQEELQRQSKEEVELVKEDLDFTFYEGDGFDLNGLLREQIILSIPMQPLCDTDCKGLCPHCGKDLNLSPCSCKPATTDPRWEPLERLKKSIDRSGT